MATKTRTRVKKASPPESSEQKLKDQVRELKARLRKMNTQMRTITKENGRLKKELNRPVYDDILEVMLPEEMADKKARKCPKCRSEDIVVIPAGIREIIKCNHKSCGKKTTLKLGSQGSVPDVIQKDR